MPVARGPVNDPLPAVTGILDIYLADKADEVGRLSGAAGWAVQLGTNALPAGITVRLNLGDAVDWPLRLPREIALFARGARVIGVVGTNGRAVASLVRSIEAALSEYIPDGAA